MSEHHDFEEKYPKPGGIFFDADKQKYQIAADAGLGGDLALLTLRRSCQQYNSEWQAYLHGRRASPWLPIKDAPTDGAPVILGKFFNSGKYLSWATDGLWSAVENGWFNDGKGLDEPTHFQYIVAPRG